MAIRIAGAGCCLMDILYPGADFSSAAFEAARSRVEGDGGLSPGRLVFYDDAERFAGRPFGETLASILGPNAEPAAENVGGPSVVSLIHAAQMLEGEGIAVSFHGAIGEDSIGRDLRERLARTPLDASRLEARRGRTSTTYVLSDASWDGGRGERCFVNDIGAAERFLPADLGDEFFEADIVALGGTGLVPRIHDGLPGILARARSRGALTAVNTVFDFRSERRDPVGAWPLGGPPDSKAPGPPESYANCDLLVMDRDEALRLAGARELESALAFFRRCGAGAFVVTRGGESVLAWAGEGRFAPATLREIPVCDLSPRGPGEGKEGRGDTTGCGDNFAGGILAALALQMKSGRGGAASGGAASLDLVEAVSWGIAAGAFALRYLGGTYYETALGEKRGLVSSCREDWLAKAL